MVAQEAEYKNSSPLSAILAATNTSVPTALSSPLNPSKFPNNWIKQSRVCTAASLPCCVGG